MENWLFCEESFRKCASYYLQLLLWQRFRSPPPHDSALLITNYFSRLPFVFIHAHIYYMRLVVVASLFQHCIQSRRKAVAAMMGEKEDKVGWKYLWLFIPSSSFSIRLSITDVGSGIFLPFSVFLFQFSLRRSFVRSLLSFLFLFFGHKHTPRFVWCYSYLLLSLSYFLLKLKNAIINNYSERASEQASNPESYEVCVYI